MSNIKEEAKIITFPDGLDSYEYRYTMPSDTETLIGVGLYIDGNNTPPFLTTIGLGVSGKNEAVAPTCYKNYLDGTEGKYYDRFKSVNVESKGNDLTVYIKTNGVATGQKTFRMIIHFIYTKGVACD